MLTMDSYEDLRQTIWQILGRFEVDKVSTVEKELSAEDRISLYYLLNDDPKSSLRVLKSGREGVVSEWCRELATRNGGEWKLRLIESLALMQLYRTLQRLGYRKRDLAEVRNILDMAIRSRDFDVRKALYSAVDTLTEPELDRFIHLMDGGKVKREPANLYRPRHVELYLLEWLCEGKIGLETESLNNVVAKLDYLNLTSASESLRCSVNKLDISENLEDTTNTASPIEEEITGSLDCYPIINKHRVGLCIILNQENYRPSSNHKVRRGSQRDCEQLVRTMKKMRVECDVLQDLQADQIFPSIENSVRHHFLRDIHSLLFVVIMAHGDKDRVFGVDGDAVDSRIIGETLSNARLPCLKDKPKVVIFQSCRGDLHYDAREVEADGPTEGLKVKPWMDHFIICYSTIPGFKSYRDPTQGSLYIQKLCENLESMYQQHDVHYILMSVTREFYEEPKKLKLGHLKVGMVPMYECSLSKSLFLYTR